MRMCKEKNRLAAPGCIAHGTSGYEVRISRRAELTFDYPRPTLDLP